MSLFSCTDKRHEPAAAYSLDSAAVSQYIEAGNKIYAAKASSQSFLQSMEYYDSAYHVAQGTKDTYLLAQSIYAKGRAYDAINHNPQKTIEYYTQAAKLYATLPGQQQLAWHIQHLVAHSYDKVSDSTRCINTLTSLYQEISRQPDSIKRRLKFTAEMALISTAVHDYDLAETILRDLTKREWIKNDPSEYDYLDHYFLTQSRLQVYRYKHCQTPYLDSLEMVYSRSGSLLDSAYYCNELRMLYTHCDNKTKEAGYKSAFLDLSDRLNNPGSLKVMQERLSQMELSAIQQKQQEEQKRLQIKVHYFYLLCLLLLIISVLALFLVKRNREINSKKNELQQAGDALHLKNIQNELLHTELQHRVKNNLQMILSLIDMQERKLQQGAPRQHLQDIRLRIESIAGLHRQMTNEHDAGIHLKAYFTQLVNTVTEVISHENSLQTQLDLDDIALPSGQGFPLGLLINEWVTNSIKYANVPDGKLFLYLSIGHEGPHIVVRYRDSGSPVLHGTVKPGLGTTIMNLLTAQLQGTLQRDDQDCFTYHLTIPAHEA